MNGKSTWEWKFPEGMTLGELRTFIYQCDGMHDESKVKVRIKFGGEVKDIKVESER